MPPHAVAQHEDGRERHSEGAHAALVGNAGAVARTDLQQKHSGDVIDVERVGVQRVQHAVVHAVLVLLGGECPGPRRAVHTAQVGHVVRHGHAGAQRRVGEQHAVNIKEAHWQVVGGVGLQIGDLLHGTQVQLDVGHAHHLHGPPPALCAPAPPAGPSARCPTPPPAPCRAARACSMPRSPTPTTDTLLASAWLQEIRRIT